MGENIRLATAEKVGLLSSPPDIRKAAAYSCAVVHLWWTDNCSSSCSSSVISSVFPFSTVESNHWGDSVQVRSFYSGTIQISLLRICKRPVSLPHRLIWSPNFINIYQISSWSFWFPTELVQIKSMRKLPSFLLIGKKLKVQISQVGFLFFFFLINPVFFLKTLLFNSSSIVFIFIVCTFEGKHEIPRHGHMCVCIYIYVDIYVWLYI